MIRVVILQLNCKFEAITVGMYKFYSKRLILALWSGDVKETAIDMGNFKHAIFA